MPNKSSHAGHVPERSCVICRTKKAQDELLRFVLLEGRLIFDKRRELPSRGYYLCEEAECFKKLEKWLRKKHRKAGK